MTTRLQSTVRRVTPLAPALQLIATTAASWNLLVPLRPRQRAQRIALHRLVCPDCGPVAQAA